MSSRLIAGVVLALCTAMLTSCHDEISCTLVACSDSYTITLRPAVARFAAGEYTVRVTPSVGGAEACTFVVSDDPSVCASGHCVPSASCLGFFFVGYPADDRVDLAYPDVESPVVVEVEVDGQVVATATFELEYQVVRPNGPRCGPECRQASSELFLPAPGPN